MELINMLYVLATCVLSVIIINDSIDYFNYSNHKHEFGDHIKIYENKNKKFNLLFNLIMAFLFILYIRNQINIIGFEYVLLPALIIVVLLIFDISMNIQKKWFISENGIVNSGEMMKWRDIEVLRWNDNEISILYRRKFIFVNINSKVTLVPVKSEKHSIFSIIEEKIKELI